MPAGTGLTHHRSLQIHKQLTDDQMQSSHKKKSIKHSRAGSAQSAGSKSGKRKNRSTTKKQDKNEDKENPKNTKSFNNMNSKSMETVTIVQKGNPEQSSQSPFAPILQQILEESNKAQIEDPQCSSFLDSEMNKPNEGKSKIGQVLSNGKKHEGEFQDKSKEMSTLLHTMLSGHTENDIGPDNENCFSLGENQLETDTSVTRLKTPTRPSDLVDQTSSSAVIANIKQAQEDEIEATLECVKSARLTSENEQMQVLTSKRALTDTSPTQIASASERRFQLPGLLQTESELEIKSLKTIVVALSQKLKAQEVIDQQIDSMKLNLDESNKSRKVMHKRIEEMSQQILSQVQQNRQESERHENVNKDLTEQLAKARADIHTLKSILQSAQQQITSDQATFNHQALQIEQLQQQNQILQEQSEQRETEMHQSQQLKIDSIRHEYSSEINELYEKIDRALEQRDEAVLAKKKIEQRAARCEEQIGRLTRSIQEQESAIRDKEELILRLTEENQKLSYRIEHIDSEREGNIQKIGSILSEQQNLREKDQAILQQIWGARDNLKRQVDERDQELQAKDEQIAGMAKSTQELQLMVGALRGLASIKEDIVTQNELMKNQLATNDLQIQVLKAEVDTVGDFLLEQEQKALKTGIQNHET